MESAPFSVATGREVASSGGCPMKRRQESNNRRLLAIKSRKSNRLLAMNRGGSSELINSLREYFASRNVINRPEQYEKFCNDGEPTESLGQDSSVGVVTRGSGIVRPSESVTRSEKQQRFKRRALHASDDCQLKSLVQPSGPSRPVSQCRWFPDVQQERIIRQHQIIKKVSPHAVGIGATRQKSSVCDLLNELLHGKRAKKFPLLVRLLRAPIVLAALFSLALALSLITLYVLSFHHCNNRHEAASRSAKAGDYDQPRPTSERQKVEEVEQSNASHRISSRHLDWPTWTRQTNEMITNQSEVKTSLAASSSSIRSNREQSVIIKSECSSHKSQADGNGLAFLGIPYASPPVGKRRWCRPQPVWLDKRLCNSSSEARDSEPREHCIQLSPFNRRLSGSEDCLYLDIYLPKSAIQNLTAALSSEQQPTLLPVMLYIHGGLLASGSSGRGQVNWMRARPSGQLASEMNVVLVAPNFRLQALGFMALKQLALDNGPDGSEGNYGLWDQLVALNWVKRNIGAFGGDPGALTLFGPDSASVLPLALFTRRNLHSAKQTNVDPAGAPLSPLSTFLQQPSSNGTTNSTSGVQVELAQLKWMKNTTSMGDYQQRAELEMDARNLFRSVWFMNPAVYFEMPYERANRHYARLIRSQSVCSGALPEAEDDVESLPRGSGEGPMLTQPGEPKRASENSAKLLDCLMNLTAGQVVHEYLGRDDAAFRLDDENSLPIRNIYPDQFVTLDGDIVRDSFPLKTNAAALDTSSTRPGGQLGGSLASIQFLVGTTAQAAEYWPCPRNLRHWNWLDFRRYVETSLNSFSQDTFKQASEVYKIPASDINYQKMINNEKKEANNWLTKSKFTTPSSSPIERYLSMVSDIRQVCPSGELAESLKRLGGFVDRYVIEWRPSARLARSLSRMIDYHGEAMSARPTNLALAGANSTSSNIHVAALEPMPRHAFHHWDLLAFFGFEFESTSGLSDGLQPADSDFQFQRSVRKLVKEFVHSTKSPPTSSLSATKTQSNKIENYSSLSSGRSELRPAASFTLFTLDNKVERNPNVADYKRRECQMWRRSLKQSYAWLS